jgi:histone chaperone ASF1
VAAVRVCQTDAPNTELIEGKDILGPTVILLTCSYMEQEFIRIGYYVNNEYDLQELNENPPEVVDVARVIRNILADSPRVTRFDIKWEPDTEMAEDSRDASESMAAEAPDPAMMDPATAAAMQAQAAAAHAAGVAAAGGAVQYEMEQRMGQGGEMMMA